MSLLQGKGLVQSDYQYLTANIESKEYIGRIKIGDGFYIYLISRPHWLARKMYKFLLGWTWEDEKK